jgi:glycerol-3-phosphate O-acyltransferase
VASVWSLVFAVRDLLKFEFFFPEREAFRRQVGDELSAMRPDWEGLLDGDRTRLLDGAPVLRAHWALLPFLESYQIVADRLVATGDDDLEEKPFLASCLELGRRYRLEGRVGADESVSQVLFKSALDLARNRGLAVPGPGVDTLRRAWAEEIARLRALAERVADAADRRLG